MTTNVNASLAHYWTALHDTERLALHATIYTWAAGQTAPGWVLDLGCEYGLGTLLITQTNAKLQVLGLDLDLRSLQYSQELTFDAQIPLVNADAFSVPIATGSFSGAYLINLLHLVKEPGVVLSEIKRVLKVGGLAVISVPLDGAGGASSDARKHIQELEKEINARFAQVTYPQEIYGPLPYFPPQSFLIDQQDSIWIALCWKS